MKFAAAELKTALFLGAHCDDIEIGCGGTVLKLIAEHPDLNCHWVVFSSDTTRAAEARKSAQRFLAGARKKNVLIKEFRNGFFPYIGAEIKDYFEALKGEISPDVIFTHTRFDLHQDHRVICELTWNTFRDHLILEYEIAKYDADLRSPNFFVPLTGEVCQEKVAAILDCFTSQKDKHWFTGETFVSLLRLRGIECNAKDGHAEGFYCRKLVI
ncbi:MAG: PIG-L deacetylase family protein [Burkholderiales bacterium]